MLASSRRTTHTVILTSLTKRVLSRLCTHLIVLFPLLFLSTVALAAPTLEVKVVEASRGSVDQVDASLKSIDRALKTSFPKFKQFKLLSAHRYTSQKGKVHTLKIRSGLDVKLSASTHAGGIKLKTQVNRKKGTTRAQYGELFFQAFKWEGNALILAVIARK